MITLTINETMCSALGTVWCSMASLATLTSIILLVVVLRGRMKQKKKGEENAYRNY
ncbi:MAG: hypothetical protein R3Y06_04310 [Faecalibacterium sp.]